MKYTIGDTVWTVENDVVKDYYPCPDCAGGKTVRVCLAGGVEHTIPCQGCRRGYLGPTGSLSKLRRVYRAQMGVVRGVELKREGVAYLVDGIGYRREDELFGSAEEAKVRAEGLTAEAVDEFEKPGYGRLEGAAQSTSHWRRRRKTLLRDLEYVEERLGIARERDKKRRREAGKEEA